MCMCVFQMNDPFEEPKELRGAKKRKTNQQKRNKPTEEEWGFWVVFFLIQIIRNSFSILVEWDALWRSTV